jgi:hypothetical protein
VNSWLIPSCGGILDARAQMIEAVKEGKPLPELEKLSRRNFAKQ